MSDVLTKKTIHIAIITSILFLSGCAEAEQATLEPEKPITVGRYQIVMQPSDVVLRIDTYDGNTHRLVNNPENGSYQWEKVNGGLD